MAESAFLETLPVERRLALSYAPGTSHAVWLGLFALDARLRSIVEGAREPALAQIKLAWWREELARPSVQRRKGEPLLELLDSWGDQAAALCPLVDGWEIMLGGEPLSGEEAEEIAEGRAQACVGLALHVGLDDRDVAAAARGWTFAELVSRLARPRDTNWPRLQLPRQLRPLQVLYALAARSDGRTDFPGGKMALLSAIRVGLLGI